MNIHQRAFLVLFGFVSILLSAQDMPFSDYHFDAQLSLAAVSENRKTADEYVLFQKREHEFYYDEKESQFWEYVLFHEITYVNSIESIERNNKVYYPLGSNDLLIAEGCRVVSAEGSKVLGPGAIRETEEEGRNYRYYAVEGLTVGTLVDYYFAYRRPARSSGMTYRIQGEYPVEKYEFDLRCEPHLRFDFKVNNSEAQPVLETLKNGNLQWSLRMNDLPALSTEPFSNPARHRIALSYKLSSNTATGVSNLNSYASLSENFWNSIHTADKKTLKTIKTQVKKLKLEELSIDREKVRAIEDWYKMEFAFYNSSDSRLEDMQFALANRALNEVSALKLFSLMCQAAEIPHQIVLTNDRFQTVIPEDFECYCYLDNYLLYFPGIDDYAEPGVFFRRLGLIDDGFRGNRGLFISTRTVAGVEAVLGRVQQIPYESYKESDSKMLMKARVDESGEALTVDARMIYTGYSAASFQPFYSYADEERKKELDLAIKNWLMSDTEVLKFELKNAGVEEFLKKPFEVVATYRSVAMLESAGGDLMAKVGMLIGPQSELYQEKTRVLPVEQDHNRMYTRTLEIEIPAGYECNNSEDLNFDVVLTSESDGSTLAVFRSKTTRSGNILSVDIEEYYTVSEVPLHQYESFAKVINAAADFNKVRLVFKPI